MTVNLDVKSHIFKSDNTINLVDNETGKDEKIYIKVESFKAKVDSVEGVEKEFLETIADVMEKSEYEEACTHTSKIRNIFRKSLR